MRIDFSRVEDVEAFASVPEGAYRVKVAEVRTSTTRDGDPLWGLRLEVVDGLYAGRIAAWDNLAWSERGLRRVKHVLEHFGFDVSGDLELAPEDLDGLEALVQVQHEEREDPITGTRQVRSSVPYLGYGSVAEGDAAVRSSGASDLSTTVS
jgi:hypothetical protein